MIGGTKNPDLGAIVALEPDLVVVNDEENRVEDAARSPARVSRCTRCRRDRSTEVGLEVRTLAARVERAVPPPFGPDDWSDWLVSMLTPRWWDAFVAVWRRPWMSLAIDTYGASLLDLLGVGNVFADSLDRYPEVTLERSRRRAPSVVAAPERTVPVRAHVTSRRSRPRYRACPSCCRRPRPVLVGDPDAGRGRSPAPGAQSRADPSCFSRRRRPVRRSPAARRARRAAASSSASGVGRRGRCARTTARSDG